VNSFWEKKIIKPIKTALGDFKAETLGAEW
jgi:hypothetical protein